MFDISLSAEAFAFKARFDRKAVRQSLREIGVSAREIYKSGIKSGIKTGRVYGGIQASARGEFPALRTGRLYNSVAYKSGSDWVSIGSQMFYSPFLVKRRRNMSREALLAATAKRDKPLRHSGFK